MKKCHAQHGRFGGCTKPKGHREGHSNGYDSWPRLKTSLKGEKLLRETVRSTALELVELQRRLFDVGLVETAHRVNVAAQKLGWEASAKLDKLYKKG